MEQAQLSPCKCGCGELVAGQWKRGHASRGEGGGRLLPGPGRLEDLPPEEFGDIVDIADGTPISPAGPPVPPLGGPAPDPEPGDDEPPPHAGPDWRKKQRKPRSDRGQPRTPGKITAGIRGDIDAKIRFALMAAGAIWQARDPLCGGVFVEQVPDTAEAFTDIICDSPDLVAFFAGPGGNFMKALKVGAALMPVVQVVMAHHVYHTVEMAPQDEKKQNYQQYAA